MDDMDDEARDENNTQDLWLLCPSDAVNLVDVELLLGKMGGHGAGEVPSRNTAGTHQNDALVLQRIVCHGQHLSCDCRRERHSLFSRN